MVLSLRARYVADLVRAIFDPNIFRLFGMFVGTMKQHSIIQRVSSSPNQLRPTKEVLRRRTYIKKVVAKPGMFVEASVDILKITQNQASNQMNKGGIKVGCTLIDC